MSNHNSNVTVANIFSLIRQSLKGEEQDYTIGSIRKAVFLLAVPMILDMMMDNVFVHIYGKAQTKPGRKMGHVTILGKDKHDLIHKSHLVKNTLKVIA